MINGWQNEKKKLVIKEGNEKRENEENMEEVWKKKWMNEWLQKGDSKERSTADNESRLKRKEKEKMKVNYKSI